MLPPTAKLARWGVKYGPIVLPYLRKLYEHGRWRQLAILHARTLEDGSFSWEMHDEQRIWVVWTGDDVVATYPHRDDIVDSAGDVLPGSRPTRRQDPDEVTVKRVRRRLRDAAKRLRGGDGDDLWLDEDLVEDDPGAPDDTGPDPPAAGA